MEWILHYRALPNLIRIYFDHGCRLMLSGLWSPVSCYRSLVPGHWSLVTYFNTASTSFNNLSTFSDFVAQLVTKRTAV